MVIKNQAKQLQKELVQHRRYLHKNPEIGFNVESTIKYIKESLKNTNCSIKEINGNGLLVEIGKSFAKTILIRADIDALPLKEDTELDFKSINDNMHACGHDMHTAMGIGVVKILSQNLDKLNGCVKVLFQPAEELLIGGNKMLTEGVMDNPKVDACISMHVIGDSKFSNGTILFPGSGQILASSDWFNIVVKGKGGHGAYPSLAIDPILPLTNINSGINSIISKEIDHNETAILSSCIIKGGNINNVIPNEAIIKGTLRTFSEDVRAFIKKRLEDMSINIAKAYRCEAVVEYTNGCPSVLVDKLLLNNVVSYCEDYGSVPVVNLEKLQGKPYRSTGSDDFSHYSINAPSVYFGIVATMKNNGEVYPAHHPKVMFDDSILETGAGVLSYIALKFLEDR